MRTIMAALLMMPILHTSAADLHVFAAASLTDAMKEIGASFEKQSEFAFRSTLAPRDCSRDKSRKARRRTSSSRQTKRKWINSKKMA